MEKLITALQNAGVFEHPVESLSVMETPISSVLLTGPYVYKIKKPVRFGFVDFSTLEKRRYFCHEELRLNRRLAPDLYCGVVAIGGDAEHPVLLPNSDAASGPPVIEYAVKMHQFPQRGLALELAHRGLLTVELIDGLAVRVGAFHRGAPVAAPDSPYGAAHTVQHWMLENFAYFQDLPMEPALLGCINRLRQWIGGEFKSCCGRMEQRRLDGNIRECHGDLHLGNLVLFNERLVPFDCVEFNDQLRWIDVISDAAFTVMDLHEHGYPELGRRFLNGYLSETGDYAGLALLRYYLVYRCLVRAKVVGLRMTASRGRNRTVARALSDQAGGYLALAEAFTRPDRPCLVITHGYSGAGKSRLAGRLVEAFDAVHIRSDVERKRLFKLARTERPDPALSAELYGEQADRDTYDQLARHAASAVRGGYTALVDAAFLNYRRRERFQDLADELGVALVILDCEAPANVLRLRINKRRAAARDPSDADEAVLEMQRRTCETLTAGERSHAITVNTVSAPSLDDIVEAIRARAASPPLASRPADASV